MDNSKQIEEINGKKYLLNPGGPEEYEGGPSYHEVEFHVHEFVGGGSWRGWDPVDNSFVLCGKCKTDTFKVSACNSDYETWAYCSCGNKFLLHTG